MGNTHPSQWTPFYISGDWTMNHSQRIKRQQATMYRSGRLVPFFNSGDTGAFF
jgi:hypothetical protein